jgi:hypothetical protein
MNKKILVFAVALMAVVMVTLPVSLVSATKPMPVSFSITIIPSGPPSAIKMAGKSDNGITTPESNIILTGGISGTGTYSGRWVIHNSGDPENVFVTSKGRYEIEATVDDNSGTLIIEACARSGGDKPALWRIVGSTGDLAGLHGQGTFTAVDFFNYNYVGQVHFDP